MITPDIKRFTAAQLDNDAYGQAVRELTAGQKETHWMWYVFPQIVGLSTSAMGKRYGIVDLDEARRYMEHPLLGPRLVRTVELVLALDKPLVDVLGKEVDAKKFVSCVTLFAAAVPGTDVFDRAVERFGRCYQTMALI